MVVGLSRFSRLRAPSTRGNGSSSGYESNEGDNIKVYVRVRPPAKNLENGVDRQPCVEVTSANTLVLQSKPDPKTFSFDHVADINTMQEEVFGAVGKKIVEGCVNGYNGTIFAYGQTGSGKTFTMLGPAEGEAECFAHELRGVIPRGFEYLFSLIKREQEKHGDHLEFLCRCSFLEIYNEQIFDLLDPASSGLALREDLKKGIFVDGLLERDVASARDAYRVLNSGWLNRRVASTSMNRESSRSHAVFTVTLESKEKKGKMCNIKVSKLHLVDLAGSERQRDTHAEGLRLKEASSINKSLSALGNVIMALVDMTHGKQRHVHYRDSKLTFLLKDSLGGNARTYIIANVHPSAKCFGETLSTLNFARRAKMIKNRAVVNEDSTGSVTALQAEIRKLREELSKARSAMNGQVTRQVPTEPDNNSASGRDQSCSDTNNNSGNDYGQQYKEWREMIIAATEGRDRAEQEKQALVEKVQKLEELCSKKDKFVQSTKMILKFRESHIAKLERMRKGNKEDKEREEDSRDKQIQLLNEEITVLKEKVEHHPDVTRFAMENLELRAELKKLRQLDDDGNDITHELSRCHRYTLQLERQLRELLQSPQGSVDLEHSLSSSLLNLEASNAELEKFKIERGQLHSQLETTREDLKQTREGLQKTKERLINEGETYRKKILDLESDLSASMKANAELEKALETFQLKTAVERTTLNDIHMQTIKTLTSPKKSFTPNRLTPHSAASTPKRSSKKSLNKLVVNSPVIDLADEKPPNGLFRRDSFHDSGSDGEFDEPFFNFDDDQMDAEELYSETLMDELKKLQEMNNELLQKLQGSESNAIKLNQAANKQEYQVQQLNCTLASEREKHAATETELNMKNLSLTDKLRESKGENSVLKSEVEDLKIVLQSADKELETIKKQRDLESIENGRIIASLESKVTQLEIENYNQQNEIENGIETIQNLESELETLRDELQFNNHKIDEYEKMLQGERHRIRELEQELQNTNEKLHFQTETNINLMAQQDKKEESPVAIEQFQSLQSDLQKCNAICEQQANNTAELTQKLEEKEEEIASLKKRNESDKECVANLMESVVGLKKVISEKDNDIAVLCTELEECRSKIQELSDTVEEKKRKIEKLKEKLEKEMEKAAKDRTQRDSEISLAKEDLKRTTQQFKELTEALEQQQQQIATMQEDLKSKTDKINDQENELAELVSSIGEIESKNEARISELQQLAESKDNSIVMIESQATDLEHYKLTQVKLTKAIENLELGRQEKNEELATLKQKLEQIRHENEMLETKNKTLSYQLEAEVDEKATKTNTYTTELTRLKTTADQVVEKNDKLNQELEKLQDKYTDLESKLEIANFNKAMAEENADGMIEELERTQKSEALMFSEKQELNSKCERLLEEKMKLEQAVKKLGDENAKLTGHQNPQQKIQYLLAIKRENNELQQEIRKLRADKEKCRCGHELIANGRKDD
ncbi:kinesin-like protein KIF15 isoform X2 [Actinia tenebrosa]|uniref:Kinesin-like protein KIF15 isoform X2 n=1 Tax=Actinia tenebrosa TaxID=6105 RepID=A0A6P8IXW2_ACTTE|nr:kinesin-like protein KIF15 isoform X2 [Actinia tenebrosa]